MKIIEFAFKHPVLAQALERAPDVELEWVKSDVKESQQRIQVTAWVSGDDRRAFRAALEEDPTVSSAHRAVPVDGRELLQFDVVDRGWRSSFYPQLVEIGGVIESLSASGGEWQARIAFPDDESVGRFFEFLEEIEVGFDVHRIFDEREVERLESEGLTRPQRDALVTAVEIGYLDVPRTASLQDLGEALGISDQAASERIRRGVKQLVEETITYRHPSDHPPRQR